MVVFERKALTEPSGKDSSNGNSLESSKLGESHEDRKQYKRSLVSAPPWAKRKPNKMFPGPKRNPGNARGTDRNRRVYGFPSSRPLSLLSIVSEQANKHFLHLFQRICIYKVIYRIKSHIFNTFINLN